MKNQKAVDSYIGSIGEIATLLEDLKGYVVDNHMDIAPEDVNWRSEERRVGKEC